MEGKAANNSMAVTAFLNQKYSKGDLHEFWNLYCSGITARVIPNLSVTRRLVSVVWNLCLIFNPLRVLLETFMRSSGFQRKLSQQE